MVFHCKEYHNFSKYSSKTHKIKISVTKWLDHLLARCIISIPDEHCGEKPGCSATPSQVQRAAAICGAINYSNEAPSMIYVCADARLDATDAICMSCRCLLFAAHFRESFCRPCRSFSESAMEGVADTRGLAHPAEMLFCTRTRIYYG